MRAVAEAGHLSCLDGRGLLPRMRRNDMREAGSGLNQPVFMFPSLGVLIPLPSSSRNGPGRAAAVVLLSHLCANRDPGRQLRQAEVGTTVPCQPVSRAAQDASVQSVVHASGQRRARALIARLRSWLASRLFHTHPRHPSVCWHSSAEVTVSHTSPGITTL